MKNAARDVRQGAQCSRHVMRLLSGQAGCLIDSMLVIRSAGPPLASQIEALWYYNADEITTHTERVLPSSNFHLTVDLATGRGAVAGPRSTHMEIKTGMIGSIIGVVFRPGAARAFWKPLATDFSEQLVLLEGFVPTEMVRRTQELCEASGVQEKFAVLENFLTRLRESAEQRFTMHPSIAYALEEFRASAHLKTVLRISKEAGLSRRRFAQLFREQVGMSPKRYCRLLRFQRVVQQVNAGVPIDWTAVALAAGYCDQAHLALDFREFAGMSPGSYLATDRPFATHVRIR